MAKKRLTAKEKRLIRDLLEEEELLLDEFVPQKKIKTKSVSKKEEVELLTQLLGEAEKEYTEADRQFVSNLLTRMPEKKMQGRQQEPVRNLDEELVHLHSTEETHMQALDKALSSYPRVHRFQIIKILFILLILLLIGAFLVTSTNIFDLKDATGVVVKNSTLYLNRTVDMDLNYKEILGNPIYYEADQVTITGFLRHYTVEERGVLRHQYFLVDDYGEELELTSLSERNMALFPEIGTTVILYNVTGKLRQNSGELDLRVSFITSSPRPKTTVSEPAHNIIVGKFA